ncbi:MAG: hypothetical protein LAO77_18195 [Acidobacteriia bacterium]|nr:hypothetical protein [Terriglobia bacterium]
MSLRGPRYPCVRPVRFVLLKSFLIGLSLLHPIAARAAVMPAPPQTFLDTTPIAPTGATIAVAAGQDFQAALNAAQPGDQITLQAGAVYTGPFTLPAKSGSGWITIRTSAPDSSLPPYGTRITPAYAGVLPKIVSSSTSPAIMTAPGAHNYRFVGVEVTTGSGITMSYSLITLGDGSSAQNSLAQVPYALIFDRVYVHGNSTLNLQRAFAFNSASTAVVNSYISEIHYAGSDSQAICGWNGPGPFKIVNDYLEASTENILFGGADPYIANLVPSDIEVRGNWVNKPTSWMGSSWTVKNLFELKNARRVLVDGNIFEHNWPQAQNGYSILFTVRDQYGTAPWSIVADVTFTHNVVRHVANGINVLGEDDIYTSQEEQRLLVQNNLFDDVNAANWGGNGRLFQVLNAAANLTIDHNTAFQSGEFILASELPQVAFTYTNNIAPNNQYGIGGDGCFGLPLLCISTFLPGSLITSNAIVGGAAASYPVGNAFPPALNDVGFVDLTNGVYQLSASSPYRNAGTDGKDLGVDWNALTTAVAGVINGVFGSTTPPTNDTTPPTVAITAPANGATMSGTVTVAASAFDASGIAKVVLMLDGVASATLTTAPYQASWDTTGSANATHTLAAVATDTAGNQATSATISVTVSNVVATQPPTISSVGSSAVTSSSATIGWVTSTAADSQVQYGTTTAYGSTTTLDGTLVSVHSQSLSGLAPSTLYHYRVLSHDASGNLATSGDFTFASSAGSTTQTGAVTWTSLVNVAANGNSLTKTGGCDGCQDAGAVSTQTIASGDGDMEFTYSELTSERAIGLSNGNTDTSIGDIDFGLLMWPGGEVDVREGGVYRADTTAATGDTFRVSVTSGKVTYAKNGTVFYQSAGAPVYPLLVDTSLLGMSSTITNVNLVGGSSATTTPPTTTPPSTTATVVPVVWTSLVKTTASGNSLTKTAGCNGCQDAGAISSQAIASGDGYVEFTVSETTTERAIGFSHGNTDTTIGDIDFALLLWPGGEIDVRENGTYRADTTAATGDTFRIAVTGGKVTYAKNGTVFYTSAAAPVYPLIADTSLETKSATLNNVMITGGAVPVTWTSTVNVTASAGAIQKSAGCNGCADAGAVSAQAIASGDGSVEFTVAETTTERAIGLSHGNTDTTIGDIDFALLLWPGGEIDVREAGVYRTDTTAATGDKFRVAISGGKVTYAKNGVVFYTSATAPSYPLLVDTSLLTSASTLGGVVMSGGQ